MGSQWRNRDFIDGCGANPKDEGCQLIILLNIFWKLHENDKILEGSNTAPVWILQG